MQLMAKSLKWVLVALVLVALLVVVEGSFGHDGLLCEWGIDTGATSNGCR